MVHATSAPTGQSEWLSFLHRYGDVDGRIIDNGNGGISHSEGQGVGLLSAAHYGTRADFDRILGWTRRHLGRSYDALHSWCYHAGASNPVPDENNATDGDLLIGYALLTAADRWDDNGYRERGVAIARAVRSSLLRETEMGIILLPAIEGFEDAGGLTFNPSYYIFPALRAFAKELPDAVWQRVWNDGLEVLARARFGRWDLSPDWAYLARRGAAPSIASGHLPRCSFDAVRLPLYLCWASCQGHPAVTSFAQYWNKNGGSSAPAWSDLNGPNTAPYRLTPGMDAIRRLVNYRSGLSSDCVLPLVGSTTDYYAAALIMLARVAMEAPSFPTA